MMHQIRVGIVGARPGLLFAWPVQIFGCSWLRAVWRTIQFDKIFWPTFLYKIFFLVKLKLVSKFCLAFDTGFYFYNLIKEKGKKGFFFTARLFFKISKFAFLFKKSKNRYIAINRWTILQYCRYKSLNFISL